MQAVETSAEGLKREFTITVPATEIEAKITAKLNDLSTQVHMRGFRPGKVPPSLLRKMYGKSVLGEVLEEAVSASSQQALADNSLTAAMQPKIEVEKFEEGAELTYTMAVEIMPDIEPMDFASLELERLTTPVTDDRVEAALRTLAEQQKTFEPISRSRKSRTGDMLVVDFVGKIDDATFEGGTATDLQLELGTERFIPGFEQQLIGAKAGDEVVVEVAFPDDYSAEDLAGKDAKFEVTVKEIRQVKAVEVDDEFAKQMGLEGLDALKTALRGQLEQEMSGLSRMRLKRTLLDALAENHDFEVPAGMVEMEYDQICRQLQPESVAAEAAPHEHDHDHDHDHDADDLAVPAADEGLSDEQKAEYRQIAVRRVRLGLLLSEVGRRNTIEVGADEVNRSMTEQARRFPGQEREVMNFYRDNVQAMAQLRAPLFEDKVIDFILEMAQISELQVSAEELTREPDDEAPGSAAPAGEPAAKD